MKKCLALNVIVIFRENEELVSFLPVVPCPLMALTMHEAVIIIAFLDHIPFVVCDSDGIFVWLFLVVFLAVNVHCPNLDFIFGGLLGLLHLLLFLALHDFHLLRLAGVFLLWYLL